MRKITNLAKNTFWESIRDRVLNTGLLFALALIGASVLFGRLSIGQDQKIIRDFGLAAIEVFGVAIAIFIGTSLLHREVDQRTIYVVLSKPVARHEFLIGKFLGLSATLTVLLATMTCGYILLLAFLGAFDSQLLWQVALVWVQLLVVVALSIMFSTFTSPVMAMMFTFSLYLIGHNLEGLRSLGARAQPAVKVVTEGLFYALPNLSHLDIKNQVVYGAPFSLAQWGVALAYGGSYVALALCVGMLLFARREI